MPLPPRGREAALTELIPSQPTDVQTESEGAWRIVGVIGRLYVLIESPEGLVLMDQHAAHERVLFEKMLKELEDRFRARAEIVAALDART